MITWFRNLSRKTKLVIGVATAIILLAGIIGLITAPRSDKKYAVPQSDLGLVELSPDPVVLSSPPSPTAVRGHIKNKADVEVSVSVRVTLYDLGDRPIHTYISPLPGLRPGKTTSFEAAAELSYKNVGSAKMEVVAVFPKR